MLKSVAIKCDLHTKIISLISKTVFQNIPTRETMLYTKLNIYINKGFWIYIMSELILFYEYD